MSQADIVEHLGHWRKSKNPNNMKTINVNDIDVVVSDELQDEEIKISKKVENISGPSKTFNLFHQNGNSARTEQPVRVPLAG